MAKVYINDVLQTSPINMEEHNVSVSLPAKYSVSGTPYVKIVKYNGSYLYCQNPNISGAKAYLWNGKGWTEHSNLGYGYDSSIPQAKDTAIYILDGNGEDYYYVRRRYINTYDNSTYNYTNYIYKYSNGTSTTLYSKGTSVSGTTPSWTDAFCPTEGVYYNNKLYILGAYTSSDSYTTIQVFDLQNNTLQKVTTSIPYSYKWGDQPLFVINDNIYISSIITEVNNLTIPYYKFNVTTNTTTLESFTLNYSLNTSETLYASRFMVDSKNNIHIICGIYNTNTSKYTNIIDAIYDTTNNTFSYNTILFSSEILNSLSFHSKIKWGMIDKKIWFFNPSSYYNPQFCFAVDEDNRNMQSTDKIEGTVYYKIVSSTVNLPNNQTITFDSNGDVVSN